MTKESDQSERPADRLLNRIIIYGFSLAFGMVVASAEAMRPGAAGFSLQFSRFTVIAFVVTAALLFPLFRIIVYSPRAGLRKLALFLIVMVGLGAFFYPLRLVPPEKHGPVFVGLSVAVVALSCLGALLVMLHRFFEHDDHSASR